MPRDWSRAAWYTSTRTSNGGACVEVAIVPDAVGMRDTKDRQGPMREWAPGAWWAFVAGVKRGEFDL